jgi:GxxExxY protein
VHEKNLIYIEAKVLLKLLSIIMGIHLKEDFGLSGAVLGAAIKVHSFLGPGMLESAYRRCLAHQLMMDGFEVQEEKPVPIVYEGLNIEAGYRIDLLVENKLVVELKVTDTFLPVHTAQVLTYLKFGRYENGLLINFNVESLKFGIKRLINRDVNNETEIN